MRCLLVLLATATARKNKTSKLVLFWHFHKAGGTSFCRMLKEAKLREGGYNCGYVAVDSAAWSRAADAHATSAVRQLPPSESRSMDVSTQLR